MRVVQPLVCMGLVRVVQPLVCMGLVRVVQPLVCMGLQKGIVFMVLPCLQEEWPLLINFGNACQHLSLSHAGLSSCRRSSSHGWKGPSLTKKNISSTVCTWQQPGPVLYLFKRLSLLSMVAASPAGRVAPADHCASQPASGVGRRAGEVAAAPEAQPHPCH